MDIATIAGVVVAFGCVLAGVVVEGGHLGSFLSLSSLLIVLGGSLGATVTGFPLADVKRLPFFLIQAVKPKAMDFEGTLKQLVEIAGQARRKGVLSLESSIAKQKDELIRTGLQLIVDGADTEILEQVLMTRMNAVEVRSRRGREMFEALGGFCPTLGIVGTVTGLVHVLGNLSEPEKLGSGIAAAFVATLYGISFANMMFLPIANKLKARAAEEGEFGRMILCGLVALQSGDNPLVIEQKLTAFVQQQSAAGKAKGKQNVAAPKAAPARAA